jgi:phosphatidylserine/phosphatidylglycerophosphate/cardiolipin synthase-like enzyme
MRVLETLVRVRTRTDDSFAVALARRTSSLPSGATLVVALHPYLFGDEALAAALVSLARRGFRVACLVYDVREDAHSPESPARHRRYLRGLARAGIELWNEKGAPLLGQRALVAT